MMDQLLWKYCFDICNYINEINYNAFEPYEVAMYAASFVSSVQLDMKYKKVDYSKSYFTTVDECLDDDINQAYTELKKLILY